MATLLAKRALEADLAFIKDQLTRPSGEYDTVRLMWEQRMEAIETELKEYETRQTTYAEVALLFQGQPVIGSEEIRLDFASKFLDEYQTAVSAVAALRAGKELADKGRLPSVFSSRLYLKDMLRGSVGFLVEESRSKQLALVPSLLKEAVEETTHIIGQLASTDVTVSNSEVASLSPRVTKSVQRMAKVLHDAGAETRIVTARQDVALTHDVISTLYARLSEVEFLERQESRRGILLGLFPERQQFEFQPQGGGALLYGPVSEDLDRKYKADPEFARSVLFQPVDASFTVVGTVRGGILQTEEWTLSALSLLRPAGLLAE